MKHPEAFELWKAELELQQQYEDLALLNEAEGGPDGLLGEIHFSDGLRARVAGLAQARVPFGQSSGNLAGGPFDPWTLAWLRGEEPPSWYGARANVSNAAGSGLLTVGEASAALGITDWAAYQNAQPEAKVRLK